MIEEVFLQYGLLGMMMGLLVAAVRYLAKRDEERDARLTQVVENNTVALTRFVDASKKCEVRKT